MSTRMEISQNTNNGDVVQRSGTDLLNRGCTVADLFALWGTANAWENMFSFDAREKRTSQIKQNVRKKNRDKGLYLIVYPDCIKIKGWERTSCTKYKALIMQCTTIKFFSLVGVNL